MPVVTEHAYLSHRAERQNQVLQMLALRRRIEDRMGWVSRDNAAHAVHFANLITDHQDASTRLSVSIGGWGEDSLVKRKWIYIEARPTSHEMMVRDPEESLYEGTAILGTSMTR